eukprot:UN06956
MVKNSRIFFQNSIFQHFKIHVWVILISFIYMTSYRN